MTGLFVPNALKLLRQQLGPVFPVEPGGKRPLGRLVPNGLKNATEDEDTVRRLGREAPDANVGVVTGVYSDALDVDNASGWQSLARLVEENGCLPPGPVVMTPGDGAHYFFAPTGIGNRAGFAPGLDWRGTGGYVVGAGSVHPNGGVYEWAVSPDEASLEPAPAWLVELLTKTASFPQDSGPPREGVRRDGSPYGRRALESEVGRVALAPEGQRNDQLNRSAHALGQLVGAGVLDVDDVIDALLVAASRAGLSESEARATIASGLRAGLANPRRVAS
jgi:hypothetical protein